MSAYKNLAMKMAQQKVTMNVGGQKKTFMPYYPKGVATRHFANDVMRNKITGR